MKLWQVRIANRLGNFIPHQNFVVKADNKQEAIKRASCRCTLYELPEDSEYIVDEVRFWEDGVMLLYDGPLDNA